MKRRIWRYLLAIVLSNERITKDSLNSILFQNLRYLYGEQIVVKTWPKVIYFNPKSKEAIIRCSHNAINEVRASLALITEINDHTAAIHVIRVSGTSKSLKGFLEN